MAAIGQIVRTAITITVLIASPLSAQNIGVVQSDILVLDTERLFAETQLGKRMTSEYQAERDKLIAHNRQIEAELEAEEKALTQLRSEKSPEEFRILADAFDTKVQKIRRDSERRVLDLERSRELGPIKFMRMLEPVLIEILNDADASVLMDTRSLLLRADVVDITDVAISRVDAAIGTGDGIEKSEPGSDESDNEGSGQESEPVE